MHKFNLKFSLLIFVLLVWGGVILHCGVTAEAAQTVNGKALGSVDDVVKEISGGELSIPKKGLITIRGGDDAQKRTYLDVFATTFSADAQPSAKRRIFENPSGTSPKYYDGYNERQSVHPTVSRRLYNGKRALMFHNFAKSGELKYYFKTLSNTRDENSTDVTPDALVNSVRISDFGEYTQPKYQDYGNRLMEVYGTGVMNVKNYEREIFVGVSSVSNQAVDYEFDSELYIEFFALSADVEGKMEQEPLTELTQKIPYRGSLYTSSAVFGDFDGDKHDNEMAVMMVLDTEIRLFVYRLILKDGKLELRAMDNAGGIQVYSNTTVYQGYLESQPVSDMVAGNFDGEGGDEIAVLYKRPTQLKELAHNKGWTYGPIAGDVNCAVYQWNAEKHKFDKAETAKAYNKYEIRRTGVIEVHNPIANVSGIVGLRATAADLDGDGKDEIATVLLGYYHRKQWDAPIKAYKYRDDYFSAYPHLAVWTFNRGSIKPVHDDAHVMGGGDENYNYGTLYDLVKDDSSRNKKLLSDTPSLEFEYVWFNALYTGRNKQSGTNPEKIYYLYGPRELSIAAGPFTGQIGTFSTVDDIAVSWKDKNPNDCVTVFKTKFKNGQFNGFEDGKLVLQDRLTENNTWNESWRGLVAVDMAGEGVELDTPTHLRKKSDRSYVAVLNAIPYHVDTVDTDGKPLSEAAQPVNFTFSDGRDGSMNVSYGQSTLTSETSSIKQDLSQTVETMLLIDPEANGKVWSGIKGVAQFASAAAGIYTGISTAMMDTDAKKEKVWKPTNPLSWIETAVDFFEDKVESVDQRTSDETTITKIDNNITATTHDAIMYTDTTRHLWRYPVMTRPLPTWMTLGARVDSATVSPDEKEGEQQLSVTFTMSEQSKLRVSSSAVDSLYQPLHEEGNFFSYTPLLPDVEGYNEAGLLAGEDAWDFNEATEFKAKMTFEKASKDMQHTEKNVTPSTFTKVFSAFSNITGGNADLIPDTDNPKTFSKEYSKTDSISFQLKGRSDLTSKKVAGHTVAVQPFVAKEGAMTLATAVTLTPNKNYTLWEPESIYRQKSDPALLLPLKFVKDGENFIANTNEKSATEIRGMKFYMPDFAFFSDNRLMNGQDYEIRVPLYNASFIDTDDFTVRLSWTKDNSIKATKNTIATTSIKLGGWKNDKNNNKGWAVFNWTPNLTSCRGTKKPYYFYVEIDPANALDEVHEERYNEDNTIKDYGGNNTGFYPFYVYNQDEDPDDTEDFGTLKVAADESEITNVTFTDGDGKFVQNVADYLKEHESEQFVTLTANFTYNGPDVAYAFFEGYTLTQAGHEAYPSASLNNVTLVENIPYQYIDNIFTFQDFALFNGTNSVTFTLSPSDVINSSNTAMFRAIAITYEAIAKTEEEYPGEETSFTLDAIPGNIVSSATEKTYTLTASEEVFWKISSVKLNGSVSTSDEEDDDRTYLRINLDTGNEAMMNYGTEATITVGSIIGYTPKGDYEITVQKSADDGDEWTEAGTLKFTAANSENSKDSSGNTISPSNSGCNAGFTFFALSLVLSALIFKHKAL